MADVQYTQQMGGQGHVTPGGRSMDHSPKSLTTMTNIAGAAVSLALIAGVGVWGWQLMKRDVSGIPVVRAIEGEMRVRPQEPGGQLALNQGLAVNDVAAEGQATPPADRLVLAPRPVELTDDDTPMAAFAEVPQVASVQQSAPTGDEVKVALQTGEVDDLVAQLTAGVDPIEAQEGAVVEVAARIEQPAAIVPAVAVVTGPGVKLSLRPKLRPASAPAIVVPARAEAVAAQQSDELEAASLPAGTRLVQLGAFDSPEIARSQWGSLQGRFGDYLAGKARIVQKAQSGGRTFYRLRAHGFTDLSDARRFCSALVAEGADCIPVVTR